MAKGTLQWDSYVSGLTCHNLGLFGILRYYTLD